MKRTLLLAFLAAFIVIILVLGVNVVSAEIKVFDANDQHLGILLNFYQDGDEATVRFLIPSLDAFTDIHVTEMVPGTVRLGLVSWGSPDFYYKSSDCSGPAFTEQGVWISNVIIRSYESDDLYLVKATDGETFAPGSRRANWGTEGCEQYGGEAQQLYPISEAQLPFDLPVAVPVRLQYNPGNLLTKPHTFAPNTPARASEVNENFDVLYDFLNQ